MSAAPVPALSPKAEEIIRRANELLAQGGYNGFSYADIAESVGVRKASIHHHFPSKADLVKATVVRHRAAIRDGMAALDARTPDPLDRLRAYCGYWAECIEAASPPICICAMLAAELPAIPPEVAAEVEGHFAELTAWLAAAMATGASTGRMQLNGTATSEAATFMASIHGAMLSARALRSPTLFAEIATRAVDSLRP